MLDGTGTDGALHPGDICITGENAFPRFRVIAVVEDRAWIRDVETGRDAVVAVGHCRPVEDEPEHADAPSAPVAAEARRDEREPSPEVWPDGTARP